MTAHGVFTGLPAGVPALDELKQKAQWVAWSYQTRNGRVTKPPINAKTGKGASVSKPADWSTYDQAEAFAKKHNLPGVGYVLTADDGYTGIDLDHCIGADGSLEPWAEYVLMLGETYAEVSPSGRGLRLLAKGELGKSEKSDAAGVEMYKDGRYLTITGNHLPTTPDSIAKAPFTIEALNERIAAMKPKTQTPEGTPPPAARTDFIGQVNTAALASLSGWVPEVLPAAKYHESTRAYRVASEDLGRGLEEDLALHPTGIRDHGLECGLTAVDVVLEYGELPDGATQTDAAVWLCERLGKKPKELGHMTAADEFGVPVSAGVDKNTITARPYTWADPSIIPPRQWVFGRHLIRKFVSVTVAPGNIGKSSLTITEAISMVSGRNIIGQAVSEPLRVWYWNLEDPYDELQRRVQAACQHFEITPKDLEGRLFVDSGRDQGLRLAVADKNGARIVRPVVDGLIGEMKRLAIDVLIVDPFISSHAVPENDNPAIDMVAKEWGRVAEAGNAAIELVHHTRKQGGDEITTESSRGGKALTDAARDVRVLNRMSKEEAAKAGIENHRLYFRTYSDKANMSPPADSSDWFKLESVSLANGDEVGVVTKWEWPDPFAEITRDDIRKVQASITGKEFRESVLAKDWIGIAVGEVVGLDPSNTSEKEKIKAMVRAWIDEGWLKVRKIRDEKGKDRPVVEVGKLMQENEFGSPE